MRILHLAWEYPPLIYGGIAPHVAQLASAQAALGHEIWVVTQAHPQALNDYTENGVRVIRVPHHPPVLKFTEATLLAWVASLNTAMSAAALRVPRPDLIHAHDWVTAWSAAVAHEGLDLPVVATFHSTERGRHQGHLPSELSRSVHELEAWLAGMSERVITCSAGMATEVSAQFGGHPTVIPNGVDASAWRVPRNPGSPPLIVFAGRLEWEKGIFDLVDALPRLRRAFPGLRLVIAGRGGQESALRERIAARRVKGAVDLVGHQSQPELARLFARANAVVVPSRYEPFGIVALEAAAAGAPLVLARTGGLAEVGGEGATASMFEPGDVDGLFHAVVLSLGDLDRALQRSAQASEELTARYRWPGIAAATLDVYQEAYIRVWERETRFQGSAEASP